MSAACSRAQDGNIHVQFPNSSERTCILPFEITERSEVLKNLLLDTDAGGICQLPEKVAQAWLHSCALELYELATEAPDTLVSYALVSVFSLAGTEPVVMGCPSQFVDPRHPAAETASLLTRNQCDDVSKCRMSRLHAVVLGVRVCTYEFLGALAFWLHHDSCSCA